MPISALNVCELPEFLRLKTGSKNTMVNSDFRSEVEIRQFCARTLKNMQYNP